MTTNEQLEQGTIEAFAAWRKDENAQIEYIQKDNPHDAWSSNVNPAWKCSFHYRIKPEPIPQGVFWNSTFSGFCNVNGGPPLTDVVGCPVFRAKWLSRVDEFPKYEERKRTIPLGPEDFITNKSIIRNGDTEAVVLSKSPEGIVYPAVPSPPFSETAAKLLNVFYVSYERLAKLKNATYSKHGDGNFVKCKKTQH